MDATGVTPRAAISSAGSVSEAAWRPVVARDTASRLLATAFLLIERCGYPVPFRFRRFTSDAWFATMSIGVQADGGHDADSSRHGVVGSPSEEQGSCGGDSPRGRVF
jgi:hypothetical protein